MGIDIPDDKCACLFSNTGLKLGVSQTKLGVSQTKLGVSQTKLKLGVSQTKLGNLHFHKAQNCQQPALRQHFQLYQLFQLT